MIVYVLLGVIFINGVPAPDSGIAGIFPTKTECMAAKAEFDQLPWNAEIVAAGTDCVPINVQPVTHA